jgi:hypothetical protein
MFTAIARIFAKFAGNSSLTLKGSVTSVTHSLPNRTALYWNATAPTGGGQTKREQVRRSVNRKLRKPLLAQA